jgi:hypothetical protein
MNAWKFTLFLYPLMEWGLGIGTKLPSPFLCISDLRLRGHRDQSINKT